MGTLTSIVLRYVVWGLAVIAILGTFAGYFWMKGYEQGSQKLTDHILKENAAKTKVVAAQEKIVYKTEVQVREKVRVIRTEGDERVKEIKVILREPAASCQFMSNGFVRIHTASAENTVAGPPRDSDGAPSTYTEADVAEVDIRTHAVLQECRAKLGTAIDFYQKLKALRE